MPPVSQVDRAVGAIRGYCHFRKRPQIRSLLKPPGPRPPYGPLPGGRAPPAAQDDLHAVSPRAIGSTFIHDTRLFSGVLDNIGGCTGFLNCEWRSPLLLALSGFSPGEVPRKA